MPFAGYCIPGLSTGANDGSSLANAWQSRAAAEAATVAGDEVWIPAGTYNVTFDPTKGGTAWDTYYSWKACTADGSRLLTIDEICNGTRVAFDGQSSRSYGVHLNSPLSFLEMYGIFTLNTVSNGWYVQAVCTNCKIIQCGSEAAGGDGFGGNSFTEGLVVGGAWKNSGNAGVRVANNSLVFNVLINGTGSAGVIAAQNVFVANAVIANVNTTSNWGVNFTSTYSEVKNSTFYNVPFGVTLSQAGTRAVNNYFEACSNRAISMSGADGLADFNSFFNCTAEIVKSHADITIGNNNKTLTKSKLQDPANGIFMSDAANDEDRNTEYCLDVNNSVFLTAGLPPEIVAASGGGMGSGGTGIGVGISINP